MSGPMATQPLIELLIRNNMKHIITISDVEKFVCFMIFCVVFLSLKFLRYFKNE